MPVDAEPLDHQGIELPGEKIRQVERAGLGIRQSIEHGLARIERIAVRPGNPLDALLGQHPVERATRAAVAIENQDPAVLRTMLVDLGAHGIGDPLRAIVQQRRDAGDVEMVEPAGLDHGQRLARERAAGDEQACGPRPRDQALAAVRWLWRRAT